MSAWYKNSPIFVFIIFAFLGLQALASQDCHGFYSLKSSSHSVLDVNLSAIKMGDNLKTTKQILQATDHDIYTAITQLENSRILNPNDAIEVRNTQIKKDVYENRMTSEKAQLYLHKLQESKVLLGLFHQVLFIYSLKSDIKKSEDWIHSGALDRFKLTIKSGTLADKQLMKQKAISMLDYYYGLINTKSDSTDRTKALQTWLALSKSEIRL